MQRLCVFCGSRRGDRPLFTEHARQLGESLARRGIGLVYGGGGIGMMGVLADAVLAHGGTVDGVIPRSMVDLELAHPRVTKLHVVETMHQRKALMADLSDGFVALPGGFGTADELFEILTWKQLRIHAKPVGLLNIAGYFDPLLAWIDHSVAEGFVKPQYREMIMVYDDIEALLTALTSCQPTTIPPTKIDPDDR